MFDLTPYRLLFADRQLRRIVLSSIVPRLPIGMNALGLTLFVQASSGSFARAGWVSGAYIAAWRCRHRCWAGWWQRGPHGMLGPLTALHVLAMLALVGAVAAAGAALGVAGGVRVRPVVPARGHGAARHLPQGRPVGGDGAVGVCG